MKDLINQLDESYVLTQEQIAIYAENGYVILPGVLSKELLEHFRLIISERVAELSANALPMEQRNAMARHFSRYGLWTESEAVKEFVFGRRSWRACC